jgi:hypothetical protein
MIDRSLLKGFDVCDNPFGTASIALYYLYPYLV